MKKLFVSVLAIAGLVACTTDDVVRVQQGGAIAFDTFVENATRADNISTTTDNITEFSVWAYMNAADGIVFDDELVSRNGDTWTYTNLQYWLAGNNYSFAAFAGDRDFVEGLPAEGAMGANGLGTITFTNENGTNDILYAQNFVENAAADQAPVEFQFDHLLSKVRFTFANGFANDNNKIVVKNIKMTSAEVAQLNLNTASFAYVADAEYVWENHEGTKTLEFGHMAAGEKVDRGKNAISDEDRLVIPADAEYSYTVTFDVEVYNGEQRGLEKSMEVKVSGVELVAGHSYNFVATINQENLNLNAIEFTVAVDTWEEFEFDGGAVEDEVRFVSTIEELQAALNAAKGNTSVVLGANLEGNVTVPELAGATIAINGNGHIFNGTFALVGGSTYGKGTTIFENIAFETAGLNGFDAFIYANTINGDTSTRYPDNVVIKNCTFNATGAAVDAAVGAKFWSLKGNLVVEGCEATNLHSLMQLTSCGEASVLVDGVKVTDCKNGISLQYAGNNVIRNSEIVAREYGVRADGCVAATNIENTTIEAKQPVIVRKVTVAGYELNIDEATVLTTAEPYQVIFTKGSDDAEYVAPTVGFTFNAPFEINVFPRVVNNADVFAAALASGVEQTIVLAADIDLSDAAWTPVGTKEAKFSGMIDGMGHKLTGLNIEGDKVALIAYAAENATIKNLVIENANINATSYAAAVVMNAENNVTIDNVTVSGTINANSYAAGLVLMNNDDDDAVIIKNCTNNATVTSQRAGGIAAWVTGATVIENCTNNGDIVGGTSACGITNRIAGTIKNSVNNGNIVGNGTEPSSGIAGTATAATTFEYCFNYGDVTTSKDNANASAAGILGQTPSKAATLNYCANFGAITAEQSYAAGIAYSLYGNITANYCYNAGTIYGADAAGAIAPKAQYGANDTANYCLNAGDVTSKGKVYQGSNKNNSCFYYSNGSLMSVANNTVVAEADALAVLNGGADAAFFSVENGVITIK